MSIDSYAPMGAPATATVEGSALRAARRGTSLISELALQLDACDPRLLTSRQRRSLLVQLQSLQAQVAALEGRVLVAECGPVPRRRVVHVGDADGLLADTRAIERQHGGAVHVESAPSHADAPAAGPALVIIDEAVDELAAMLHRSCGSVRHELRRARTLHHPLADVRAALEAGTISVRHAMAICDQAHRMQVAPLGEDAALDEAFARKCSALARRILPIAVTSTPGRTESQAVRLVASIDAAAERERRSRAKQQMGIAARPADDGLASVIATMSAIDAARLVARVDTLARDATASGEPLVTDPQATIGQQRVAALLHLIGLSTVHCGTARADVSQPGAGSTSTIAPPAPGRPSASSRNRPGIVEVQVLVDARVLSGSEPDAAAWVRTGAEVAPVSRDDVVALLADPSTPTVLRRLLVEPVTGALVDRGAATYAPTEALIAWLRARDQRCRFPGCTARADRCDVDHATDFRAGGPTTVANTGLLCRRHHNVKTHAGWRIVDSTADGACTFVAPSGMRYVHEPTSLASLMAGTPARRAPDPATSSSPAAAAAWPHEDPPF